MAFTVKDWKDYPDVTTPISAAALEDVEDRVTDYADTVAAAGIELGYAQITSNFTQTGTGLSDVTGLSKTVTVGTRPIIVEFGTGNISCSTTSGIALVFIQESTTKLASLIYNPGTTGAIPATRRCRIAPSAGTHTYKIVLQNAGTGNITLGAAADNPAYIHIIEV